jgi:hypothetical protein
MYRNSQLPILATDSRDFDVRRRGLRGLGALDALDASIEEEEDSYTAETGTLGRK